MRIRRKGHSNMQGNGWRIACLVALITLASTLAMPARAIETDINHYVCQKLDDFTATMSVIRIDEREMGKISRDIVAMYRLKDVKMLYKEPNKVRIEGDLGGAKGVYVYND